MTLLREVVESFIRLVKAEIAANAVLVPPDDAFEVTKVPSFLLQGPSPVEDGGDWQYDLQGVQEVSTPVALHFDPATGGVARQFETAAPPRLTVTLTLSGHAQFCEALRAEFGLE